MKYICFYDALESTENRKYVLSATNKIDYILEKLSSICDDDPIEIVSMSPTLGNKKCKSVKKRVNEKITLKLFTSFGRKNLFTKLVDHFGIPIQLLFYLLFHVKRGESVIVYHSPAVMRVIPLAKLIKGFSLILEIEEIYSDVNGDKKLHKKELSFFQKADKYIFPTQLLDEALNHLKKPSIVISGTYKVEPKYDMKFEDDKIHVVYSGTLDPRKGGALAAVAAASYLPNHHVHILGFGTDEQKNAVLDEIQKVQSAGGASCTYEGTKKGKEYSEFLQKCAIGLSTQNPDAAFNATSFPSKILAYMANGLTVVSIKIPVIVTSKVGDIVQYYEQQDPRSIAEAIKKVDLSSNVDPRDRIEKLDREFGRELYQFLNDK